MALDLLLAELTCNLWGRVPFVYLESKPQVVVVFQFTHTHTHTHTEYMVGDGLASRIYF